MVKALGVPNLHYHDHRHTGNQLAADMGVSTKNLMARMRHDNERAALRYQHKSAKATAPLPMVSMRWSRPSRAKTTKATTARPRRWCRWPHGTLHAGQRALKTIKAQAGIRSLIWAFVVGAGHGNRTRAVSLGTIANSAVTNSDLAFVRSASDREYPLMTAPNGTLMARRRSR
ncbi:hypothetical protein ACQPZP_01795 [Spirillospora sp. CA-142024]|uniref:hypothetical protein n=1 Tax=Spirillospora sp. CA-142024 TaxID=3240036 RepID=UPI003D89FE7A